VFAFLAERPDPDESASSGEQALLGAAGPVGRWGIPGLDLEALRRQGQELLYRPIATRVDEKQRTTPSPPGSR
jgi:hypothetical protein